MTTLRPAAILMVMLLHAVALMGCPVLDNLVAVPNVIGATQSSAEDVIVSAGLNVGNIATVHSDSMPAGRVLSQNPAGGATISRGSFVSLVVSLGPQGGGNNVTVPNVVGDTQASAQSEITSAGLTLGVVTQAHSNTVPAGRVISQSPAAGQSVPQGTAIAIVVSLGAQGGGNVTVPNVVGATQAAAQTNITAAGLVVGTVTQAFSDSVSAGRVISQSPLGGQSVATGSAVNLVVSKGPDTTQGDYDEGFDDGFAEDEEYWQGFDDSWDTRDGGTIYYSGSAIPNPASPAYEAGYWDGVWYAYNDGYFVAYDYAFTIGFSEGYDIAYASNYAAFLAADEHVEWLDGGFTDGYNDGFSEGRVFGAYDYSHGIAFDWLDALLDYRDGVDLTVAGVSTGAAGPVELYEYGTDPNDLIKGISRNLKVLRPMPSIRHNNKQDPEPPALSYRPLPGEVQSELETRPTQTPRSDRTITLSTTWLQRVNEYRAAIIN